MSDYTFKQIEKLLGYQAEFEQYIQSIIDAGNTFKANEENKYNKLSPDDKIKKGNDHIASLAFYNSRIESMREILNHFNRIIENIKSISFYTEHAIKVHTAVNVVKEQFPIEEGKVVPTQIKEAYNADVSKGNADNIDLDSLANDIANFASLLDKNGILHAKIGKVTILGIVNALQNIALEMSRTHSVDEKLKEDIAPQASVATQEKLRTLEEYDKKVADGDMVRISKANPRIIFTRSRFAPSRVMITGEKTREALEKISGLEKQIEAIDRALRVINSGSSDNYHNTYMILMSLRVKLEERLKNEKRNFDSKELGIISEALGKTNVDDVIEAYAELYAELQATMEESPSKADKITSLRIRLDQFANKRHMNGQEIITAIALGKKYNEERKKNGPSIDPIKVRIEYRNKVMESLTRSLEDRVLDNLKRKNLISPDATLTTMSDDEREIFNRHMRLEEATIGALKRFKDAKTIYDREATLGRQVRLSREHGRSLKR